MVNLKQIRDRLVISLFDSGINDDVETQNLETHSIKDVTRLTCSVVVY